MDSNPRKRAEEFVDKVVAPVRMAPVRDRQSATARAKLAAENRDLALRELQAGGLDPKRLNTLAADRSKARKQLAEQAHRRAVDVSAEAAARLRALHPLLPPPLDMMDVVDEVTFIRSFADQGAVVDSNIEPGNNWARYQFDASGDSIGNSGTGRLSFFTLWQNVKKEPVIVQAAAQLNVNAHLSVDADWNGVAEWFFPDSEGRATVRTRTTVWAMNSSISSIVQERDLAYVRANGGFFGGDNDTAVQFNDLLPATGVSVAGKEFKLIEVELLTDWFALNGSVQLDAQSGSFMVILPQLQLTIS